MTCRYGQEYQTPSSCKDCFDKKGCPVFVREHGEMLIYTTKRKVRTVDYKKIKALRLKQEISLTEMDKLVGLKRDTFHLYESGERTPSTNTLKKIVKILQVPLSSVYEKKWKEYQRAVPREGVNHEQI